MKIGACGGEMGGARRKWDWALFGLVAATQIASLTVVYPGLLIP